MKVCGFNYILFSTSILFSMRSIGMQNQQSNVSQQPHKNYNQYSPQQQYNNIPYIQYPSNYYYQPYQVHPLSATTADTNQLLYKVTEASTQSIKKQSEIIDLLKQIQEQLQLLNQNIDQNSNFILQLLAHHLAVPMPKEQSESDKSE